MSHVVRVDEEISVGETWTIDWSQSIKDFYEKKTVYLTYTIKTNITLWKLLSKYEWVLCKNRNEYTIAKPSS